MTFIKTKENFICENCGEENIGSGFTNHCKKCLWSKHVDIDPGDRVAKCKGMMEPVDAENKNRELRIKHKCLKCGFERWCLVGGRDSQEKIPELIAKKQ
jgi:hypothetical protein